MTDKKIKPENDDCKYCKYYGAFVEKLIGPRSVYITYYCDPKETVKRYGLDISYDLDKMYRCNKDYKPSTCPYFKKSLWYFWKKLYVDERYK